MKSFFGSCDFTTFEKKEGRKTEFSDLNNIRRKTITTKNNNKKKKERKKEKQLISNMTVKRCRGEWLSRSAANQFAGAIKSS